MPVARLQFDEDPSMHEVELPIGLVELPFLLASLIDTLASF
jgi:hypothetical protein